MTRQIPELAAANPVIMGLLEYVLDRRDEQILAGEEKPIGMTLDPRKGPRALRAALAAFTDPMYDDGELWDELVWLSRDYRCFSVKPPGRRPAGAAWEGARLYFEDSREAMIREWLDRSRPVRLDPEWQAALTKYAGRFEVPDAFPPGGLALEPGFEDFEQMLACWADLGEELDRAEGRSTEGRPTEGRPTEGRPTEGRPTESLSWRQLSARCFLGDSKYLDGDGRQALVRALFPSLCGRVHERPLLMHLYLPAQTQRVLLVENQDSFLMLADCAPEHTALVYIEGYRGGAARVRTPGVARFSTLNNAPQAARRDFLQWWQGQGAVELPVSFWGDLDYEGMQIAAALKRSFANLACWRPGYEPLLERLRAGGGHLPQQARKAGQRAIESTGCEYADGELIPALRQTGLSVDQEAVTRQQLIAAVSVGGKGNAGG